MLGIQIYNSKIRKCTIQKVVKELKQRTQDNVFPHLIRSRKKQTKILSEEHQNRV